MKEYKIVLLPGDGIGPEVMAASEVVMDAVMESYGDIKINYTSHPTGAAHYRDTGEILPDHVTKDCVNSDAVLLSAIGLTDVRLADGTEVQPYIMMGLRVAMDVYAGVRPCKLYPNVNSPLKDVDQGIDFVILRENTEGLFASQGGGSRVKGEVVGDTMLITKKGTRRVSKFAFELAKMRNGRPQDGKKMVTCVDKANVFKSMAFFRQNFTDVAEEYPEIDYEYAYIDAMTMYMVKRPASFDVVVTENMYGDILSDLGAGIVGGLGMGPSGEIGDRAMLFQPSHGSAPDIMGQNIANPLATILSAKMMFDWIGFRKDDEELRAAAYRIERAVETLLKQGDVLTPDLGGTSTTSEMGDALAQIIRQQKAI